MWHVTQQTPDRTELQWSEFFRKTQCCFKIDPTYRMICWTRFKYNQAYRSCFNLHSRGYFFLKSGRNILRLLWCNKVSYLQGGTKRDLTGLKMENQNKSVNRLSSQSFLENQYNLLIKLRNRTGIWYTKKNMNLRLAQRWRVSDKHIYQQYWRYS